MLPATFVGGGFALSEMQREEEKVDHYTEMEPVATMQEHYSYTDSYYDLDVASYTNLSDSENNSYGYDASFTYSDVSDLYQQMSDEVKAAPQKVVKQSFVPARNQLKQHRRSNFVTDTACLGLPGFFSARRQWTIRTQPK